MIRDFLPETLAAFVLLSLCVVIHASGLAVALARLAAPPRASAPRYPNLRAVSTLVATASWLLMLHLTEISVFAAFYVWKQCLPDVETAIYFSGVTYTTVGYGDTVLPLGWRLLGPLEGLTGILMCGLSTGFFFAVLSRLHAEMRAARASGASSAADRP